MTDPRSVPNTFRFFVASSQLAQGATDEAALVHQWVRVLRIRPGQTALLIDSAVQRAHHVQFADVGKQRVTWDTLAVIDLDTEPKVDITLAVGLIRAERFEWLLQKATEIGVTQIQPLLCERSRSDGGVGTQKIERWHRIVREAAEQACRARIPVVHEPLLLPKVLAQPRAWTVFLHEGTGTVPLRTQLPAPTSEVLVLSGPEGGFSPAECALMQQASCVGVGLGRRILRAETAPLVAATMVLTYAGELDG